MNNDNELIHLDEFEEHLTDVVWAFRVHWWNKHHDGVEGYDTLTLPSLSDWLEQLMAYMDLENEMPARELG